MIFSFLASRITVLCRQNKLQYMSYSTENAFSQYRRMANLFVLHAKAEMRLTFSGCRNHRARKSLGMAVTSTAMGVLVIKNENRDIAGI